MRITDKPQPPSYSKDQQALLDEMARKGGSWQAGCGWFLKNRATTTKILEELVKMRAVYKTGGKGEVLYSLVQEKK